MNEDKFAANFFFWIAVIMFGLLILDSCDGEFGFGNSTARGYMEGGGHEQRTP